jgi:hypothetical protein
LGDAFDIATQETFASGATLRHQLPAESNGATLTLNFVTPVDTYDSIAYLNLEDLLDGAGGDSFDGLELTTSLDIL